MSKKGRRSKRKGRALESLEEIRFRRACELLDEVAPRFEAHLENYGANDPDKDDPRDMGVVMNIYEFLREVRKGAGG